MRGKVGDRVRVQHIYDAILEIESYLLDKEFSDFMNNSMMRFINQNFPLFCLYPHFPCYSYDTTQ